MMQASASTPAQNSEPLPTTATANRNFVSHEVLVHGTQPSTPVDSLKSALSLFGPVQHVVSTSKVIRIVFASPANARAAAAAAKIDVEEKSFRVTLHTPPEEGPPSERLSLFGVPPGLPAKTFADILNQQLGQDKARSWTRFVIADTGLGVAYFETTADAALARGRLNLLGLTCPGSSLVLPLCARYQSIQRMRWMHNAGIVLEHHNALISRKNKRRRQAENAAQQANAEGTAISTPVASETAQSRIASLKAQISAATELASALEKELKEREALVTAAGVQTVRRIVRKKILVKQKPQGAVGSSK